MLWVGLAAALILARSAFAWTPDRPILLITGYAPGGATEVAARLLQDRMAAALGPGTRIAIEGRPGAAGAVATEWLKSRPADGTTIMLQEGGAGVFSPLATVGGARYDPISTAPNILIGNPGFAPPDLTTAAVLAKLRDAPAA